MTDQTTVSDRSSLCAGDWSGRVHRAPHGDARGAGGTPRARDGRLEPPLRGSLRCSRCRVRRRRPDPPRGARPASGGRRRRLPRRRDPRLLDARRDHLRRQREGRGEPLRRGGGRGSGALHPPLVRGRLRLRLAVGRPRCGGCGEAHAAAEQLQRQQMGRGDGRPPLPAREGVAHHDLPAGGHLRAALRVRSLQRLQADRGQPRQAADADGGEGRPDRGLPSRRQTCVARFSSPSNTTRPSERSTTSATTRG